MDDFTGSEKFNVLSSTVQEQQNKSKKSAKVLKKPDDPEVEKRRGELRKAVEERVEAEKRAHQTVLLLIEDHVTQEILQQSAKYIQPQHYRDVVTERAISFCCGYPLCDQKLKKERIVKSQQYRINASTNMVYDVTERRDFCSKGCYAASMLFMKQLSDTPVWLRASEKLETVQVLSLHEIDGSEGMAINLLADDPVSTFAAEVKKLRLEEDGISKETTASQ